MLGSIFMDDFEKNGPFQVGQLNGAKPKNRPKMLKVLFRYWDVSQKVGKVREI